MPNDDVLSEYLNECEEKLDRISIQLTKLEKDGYDKELLRSVARDVHTVKGSSQLFGYSQIGQVTHAMEECLDRLKDSPQELLKELLECLFQGLDVSSKLFATIKATKEEPAPTPDVAKVVTRLEALAKKSMGMATSAPTPQAASASAAAEARATPAAPASAPATTSPSMPASAGNPPPKSTALADEAPSDTIRVNVDILDNLMNLAGELVLIRNQLAQLTKLSENEGLTRVSQRLNVVTSELQNDVMKTRMQPIGNVLNKFQRVVRDMAKDLGKRVELSLEGAETELDKTLIEAVRDPLTHVVRNAIDHGLELPDDRKKAGKTEIGKLSIRAFHEGGQVVVEIKDDGKGLVRERIAAKAVEKGLVAADAHARLSDREVFLFIFLPGFSTAEKVSNLSGRGVGMDVVRTNIERIGGTVELNSTAGQGTTITLKIPLTLAIIPALIVTSAQEKFAIPQVKLVELLRVEGEAGGGRGIEMLQGRPVFRLRGELLPLVTLSDVLKIRPHPLASTQAQDHNIAVLSLEDDIFGLVIDAVNDSADIVVKPLPAFLKDLGAYSGATILGDGSIALTLDIAGIAHLVNMKSEGSGQQTAKRLKQQRDSIATKSHADENTEYLLIDVDPRGKYALPLCLVNRLEEFKASEIKLSGERRVVKYRDSLLPIISVRRALGFPVDEPAMSSQEGGVPVVVVKKGERYFGLQVSAIVDVIVSSIKIDMNIKDRVGIIGSLIEGEDVIAMIDALGIIDIETGHAPQASEADTRSALTDQLIQARRKYHILLAEDGSFFRRYIRQVLEGAGYGLTAECDGERALVALEAHQPGHFAVIISDIEMPNLTGLEFVQKVRANKTRGTIPMIALSSRFSQEDVSRGLALGFNRYLEKLNPDELLLEVDSILGLRGDKRHAS